MLADPITFMFATMSGEQRRQIARHPEITQIHEAKLDELVGRVLGDLGGAVYVYLVRIADALDLYRTLKP